MQEEKEEIIATEEGEDDDDDGPPPGFQCIIAPPPPEAGKAEPEDDKEEEEMEKEKEREKEEEEVEVEEDEEDDGPPPGFDCISLKPPPPIPISDIATNIKQEDTEDDEDGPPPGWEFTNLANALPKPPSAETDIKTESNEELDLDDDDGPPPGWETVLPHQMLPPRIPPLQASPTVSTNTDNIDIEMESQQKIAENDDEEPPSVSPCNPMPMHSPPPTPPLHQPPSELPTGSKEDEKKVEEKKPTTQQQLPPTPWPLTPIPAPSSSEKAQLVCGTCRKLCVYPRGSKWVQCPGCQEVNFVLEAHEVGQVKCGGCSVLLMFPHGGQKVQCSSCRFITEIGVKRFKPGKKSAITHMAFEQYIMQEWKSIPTYSENTSACFDCNICLEFARDPVVTLCGHLYCWPCIYKWFDSQTASLPPGQLPQCPVCKAETSEKTIVPLYGRGQSIYEPEHSVPPRPPASRITDLINPEGQLGNLANPYRDNEESLEPSLLNLRGLAPMALSHPVALMLGEMVYTRVFGNSASLYAYPNSYHSAGSSTPIGRRRELEADKSLSRVSIFLFCCFLLCLLLF